MEPNVKGRLRLALKELKELDELSTEADVSSQFLEVVFEQGLGEVRVSGNPEGLLYLAKVILEVATSDVEGAHYHFDTTGVLDRCDIPVVICNKRAEW